MMTSDESGGHVAGGGELGRRCDAIKSALVVVAVRVCCFDVVVVRLWLLLEWLGNDCWCLLYCYCVAAVVDGYVLVARSSNCVSFGNWMRCLIARSTLESWIARVEYYFDCSTLSRISDSVPSRSEWTRLPMIASDEDLQQNLRPHSSVAVADGDLMTS